MSADESVRPDNAKHVETVELVFGNSHVERCFIAGFKHNK